MGFSLLKKRKNAVRNSESTIAFILDKWADGSSVKKVTGNNQSRNAPPSRHSFKLELIVQDEKEALAQVSAATGHWEPL